MKKRLPFFLLLSLCSLLGCVLRFDRTCKHQHRKPVLYLYPEKSQMVQVKLKTNYHVFFTYPQLKNDTWQVLASPDGTLKDTATGKVYNYLFWELTANESDSITSGFVIKGDSIVDFFEHILLQWGLSSKEANDFIVYWAPLMQKNKYNIIRFAQKEYTDKVQLEITPRPQSLLRLFMVYKSSEQKVVLPKQEVIPFVRKGFTVVEWGGTCLNEKTIYE